MSRWSARVAVVAVLVALIGLYAWKKRPAPPTASPPTPIERLRAGRPAPVATALRGRVVDERGTGIPAATVVVAPAGFLGVRAPGARQVRTDAAGRFAVAGLRGARYRVVASAPGFLGAATDSAGPEVELVLRRGGRGLSGTIVDVGGGAVAGALVAARRLDGRSPIAGGSDAATLSDERGGYVLRLAEGTYQLSVLHDDYVAATTSLRLSGADTRRDFVLTPGARVAGVVQTRDGKPVAGALVTASGGRSSSETGLDDLSELPRALGEGGATSDEQGRFVLTGLGSGALELSARARGLASREPATVALGVGETVEGVTIVVDDARSVSGYVVARGHEDQGLPGVMVGALRIDGMSLSGVVETDETGFFELTGLGKGKYSLLAAREGALPDVMRTLVTVGDEDVDDVIIALAAGSTLRGRVEPPTATTISLQVGQEQIGPASVFNLVGAALAHTRSDERGGFELVGVPDGDFELVARAADGRRGELAVKVRGSQDGLVVLLVARARLAGRVVDDRGAPVPGAEVEATDRGLEARKIDFGELAGGGVASGDDGGFAISGLAAGVYGLRVEVDGETLQVENDEDIRLADGEQKTGLVVRVQGRRGTIRGRVVDARGAPAADVWVVAREGAPLVGNADPEAAVEQAGWRRTSRPVLTDGEGRFELRGLADLFFDLTADAGGARGHRRGVKPGDSVTLKLRPLASLAGRVSRDGRPVVDYRVRLDGPVGQDRHVHADDGGFRFERLEPGEQRILVTAEDGSAEGTTTLAAGEAGRMDLQLSGWGEVRGQVVDAFTGKPLPGLAVRAAIHAMGPDGEQALGALTGALPRTDGEGRFRVGKLGPGRGWVEVVSIGFLGRQREVAEASFELGPGEHKDLGVIRGLSGAAIDEDEQGKLGFFTSFDGPADRLIVVTVGAPADAAGLRVKDEIVSIDGQRVATLGAGLAHKLLLADRLRVGQVVTLGVERDGQAIADVVVTAVPITR